MKLAGVIVNKLFDCSERKQWEGVGWGGVGWGWLR